MKEKIDRMMLVRLPKTLFDDFKKVCDKNYKTISEEVRDLILKHVKENK